MESDPLKSLIQNITMYVDEQRKNANNSSDTSKATGNISGGIGNLCEVPEITPQTVIIVAALLLGYLEVNTVFFDVTQRIAVVLVDAFH